MELVVVGSSNMDMVISVPRIPGTGETILGGKSSMIFGGKGANQAVAAVRSGGNVAFISKVGGDIFGENMKSHFKNEGLPANFILTDEKEPTGIAQILVSEKGENSIAVAPGANMNLTVEDIHSFKNVINQAKVVLVQLEIPLETVEYIAEIANKHNTKVILNPAPAQKLNNELLEKLWLITPNESESELLTQIKVVDIDSAGKAGEILLKKGVKNVIITLGENGSLLCNKDGFRYFKAYKEKAIDTTAAGDVFNGALAVALTENKSFHEAIQYGSAAAAISVTRKGAQTSIPTIEELENYLRSSGKIKK
ncbi:Ribokinase [subsurface metagenome]